MQPSATSQIEIAVDMLLFRDTLCVRLALAVSHLDAKLLVSPRKRIPGSNLLLSVLFWFIMPLSQHSVCMSFMYRGATQGRTREETQAGNHPSSKTDLLLLT